VLCRFFSHSSAFKARYGTFGGPGEFHYQSPYINLPTDYGCNFADCCIEIRARFTLYALTAKLILTA